MAHVGRHYPISLFRDLWLEFNFHFPCPRNIIWHQNNFMFGTLGYGWGQRRVSEDAVPDYAAGTLTWRWTPPPAAHPLSGLKVVLGIVRLPFDARTSGTIQTTYDGLESAPFAFIPSFITGDRVGFTGGNPGLLIPGVGTLSFSMSNGMRSAIWSEVS